jgi:3-hydroxybutyryl-CoA dehydrogenase
MKIGVTGTPNRIAELRLKIALQCEVTEIADNHFRGYDVIFDLNFDDNPRKLEYYANLDNTFIVASSVKIQLEEAISRSGYALSCHIAGMNCLPGFINRSITEVCAVDEEGKKKMIALAEFLGWDLRFVGSRVGMYTPRVLCMIINEAYYTVQEGTASKEDIDLGMKLGTAYPGGPFEWCNEMGIKNVYETLEALWNDTHDERYKICPLLKTEYLGNKALH